MVQADARDVPVTEPAAAQMRGTNQSGMRAYNEKLILALLRRHGSLAKSDLTRLTGLSAQTSSVIMRSLEKDRLVIRGEPVRGRIGQPSVPLSLNPQGACFLGLKIGRRSAEVVLIDFLGKSLQHRQLTYPYPVPDAILRFANEGISQILSGLGEADRKLVAGLGVAMPFELWNWADIVGAPRSEMDAWRSFDIRAELASSHPFPVYVENDATSACGAELVFGKRQANSEFLYFYIGTFIGGGVVLNGSLFTGRTGNAGALGSILVTDRNGRPRQLIDLASLHTLDKRVTEAGGNSAPIWLSSTDWGDLGGALDDWLDASAPPLAQAIISASAVIEFELAVVDGWMPVHVRARLVEKVRAALGTFDAEGIRIPVVEEGVVGAAARAIGAASLPLFDKFMVDQNTLMRGARDADRY
ncbi:MAG: ROK family transcriptional regulator [Oricola sp.]